MSFIVWLTTNWMQVAVAVGLAIDAAAAVAKLTETAADDTFIASVREIAKKIALY